MRELSVIEQPSSKELKRQLSQDGESRMLWPCSVASDPAAAGLPSPEVGGGLSSTLQTFGGNSHCV